MVSALFMGITECQIRMGITENPDNLLGDELDNASMALFSYAIDTDNPEPLAVMYEWAPDYQMLPPGQPVPDDTEFAPVSEYALGVAEVSGAQRCLRFLQKRNQRSGDGGSPVGGNLGEGFAVSGPQLVEQRVQRARSSRWLDVASEHGRHLIAQRVERARSGKGGGGAADPSLNCTAASRSQTDTSADPRRARDARMTTGSLIEA
uniref:Uncharacterized protein n=1 Tax=Haptolina ericina TaxID=156174 RepID=A0A7S3C4I4_9EUKA